MESSFQRLGRGRRFRNKTADASSSTPASSATPVGSERSPASASSGASAPAASPASRAPAAPSAPGEDGYAYAPRAPAPGSTRPGLYGQTLVSTGVSDVDNLLGGGLPLGSVMLVGHDGDGARNAGDATTLLRYFVAEGLASGHTALWMPLRAGARSPARTLPRLVSPDERRAADRDDDDASKPAEKDDGLRIAWQYRRYLQQGKSLDDSRVGRGGGALAAGVSVTGASASASSGSATKNTGGVRRRSEMCHQFDLTREMDPAHADAADLRCVPFERAPELVPSRRPREFEPRRRRRPVRRRVSRVRRGWRGGAATPIAPRSTRPSAASPSNPRWDSIRSPPRLPSRVFSAPFADDSAGRARARWSPSRSRRCPPPPPISSAIGPTPPSTSRPFPRSHTSTSSSPTLPCASDCYVVEKYNPRASSARRR